MRRLRARSEFRAVYEQGMRKYSPHFVMFALSHTRRSPVGSAGTQEAPDGRSGESGAPALAAEEPGRLQPSPPAPSRFGITVSRKLGQATVRNRIRRRTREILRRHVEELGSGWDIVINPRRTVLEVEFALLDEELMELLRRLTSPGVARRS